MIAFNINRLSICKFNFLIVYLLGHSKLKQMSVIHYLSPYILSILLRSLYHSAMGRSMIHHSSAKRIHYSFFITKIRPLMKRIFVLRRRRDLKLRSSPSCGARKNLRAKAFLDFFDRCANAFSMKKAESS